MRASVPFTLALNYLRDIVIFMLVVLVYETLNNCRGLIFSKIL